MDPKEISRKKKTAYLLKGGIIVFLIMICGLAARLYGLNKYDLWFDELLSDEYSFEIIAERAKILNVSPWLLIKNIKYNLQPPLYYTVVYLYSFLMEGGQQLRMISVIFSMLSLWIFYKLARLFFNRSISIYSLIMMAFNPFQIWYAQEARAYAQGLFFSIAFIYFYLQALKTGKSFYWGSFFLMSILGIYTNYNFIFIIISSGFVIVLRKEYRRHIKKWLVIMACTAILFLPILPLFQGQFRLAKELFWLPEPMLKWLLWTFANFNLGYSADLFQSIAGLVLFGTVFFNGIYTYCRTHKENTINLFSFFLTPLVGSYMVSIVVMPIYITRQLLICSVLYYLFIAQGIYALKSKFLRVSAFVAVALLLLFSLLNYYRGFMLTSYQKLLPSPSPKIRDFYIGVHEKKNYAALLDYINKEFKQGDVLAATDPQSSMIMRLWFNRSLCYEHGGVPIEVISSFYLSQFLNASYGLNYSLNQEKSKTRVKNQVQVLYRAKNQYDSYMIVTIDEYIISLSAKRIWLISSSWDTDSRNLSENSLAVLQFMHKNYKKILSMEHDGVYIELLEVDARGS